MGSNYEYPLLDKITDSFGGASKEALDHVHIWASQHILEPQEKMFTLISGFGIPVKNIP